MLQQDFPHFVGEGGLLDYSILEWFSWKHIMVSRGDTFFSSPVLAITESQNGIDWIYRSLIITLSECGSLLWCFGLYILPMVLFQLLTRSHELSMGLLGKDNPHYIFVLHLNQNQVLFPYFLMARSSKVQEVYMEMWNFIQA